MSVLSNEKLNAQVDLTPNQVLTQFGSQYWLVSNFIPTDFKKFEFQNLNETIRFSIKNKLELKKSGHVTFGF